MGLGTAGLALVVAIVAMLIAHVAGGSPPVSSPLVPPSIHPREASVAFAQAVEILLPEVFVIWLGFLLDDVHRHGRAIWAPYPLSSVVRAGMWWGLVAVQFSLGAYILAVMFQLSAPTEPLMDVIYVMPVVIWVTGIQYAVAEAVRSPQLGAVASIVVSLAAYSVQKLSGPIDHPAWWMLYAATGFSAGPGLTVNRWEITGLGFLGWAVGALIQSGRRKRGGDV